MRGRKKEESEQGEIRDKVGEGEMALGEKEKEKMEERGEAEGGERMSGEEEERT